jgi:preprotein translocase subunit Sss1
MFDIVMVGMVVVGLIGFAFGLAWLFREAGGF